MNRNRLENVKSVHHERSLFVPWLGSVQGTNKPVPIALDLGPSKRNLKFIFGQLETEIYCQGFEMSSPRWLTVNKQF